MKKQKESDISDTKLSQWSRNFFMILQKSNAKYLIAFLILLLLPFAYNSFFTYPSADDYCYANVFLDNGFLATQKSLYENWSSRYTSTLFMSMSPLSFYWDLGYKLWSLALVIGLVVAVVYFFREYTKDLLDKKWAVVVGLAVSFLYFFQMPNATSGLYWLAGALTYTLPVIFLLFTFSFIKRYVDTPLKNKRMRGILHILTSLLILLVVGGNEVVAATLLIVLAIFTIYAFKNKSPNKWYFLSLVVVAVISTLVVLLAPGNQKRASALESPYKGDILYALSSGTSMGVKYILQWLKPIIIFFLLLILPLAEKFSVNLIPVKKNFNFPHPIISIITWLGLVLLPIVLSFWSLGGAPPERVVNYSNFIFLFGLIINIVIIILFLKIKFPKYRLNYPLYLKIIFAAFALFFLIFGNSYLTKTKESNLETTVKDMIANRYVTFEEKMQERVKILKNNKGKSIELQKIPSPNLVSTNSLTSDPEDWRNSCYATYYQLDEVVEKQ